VFLGNIVSPPVSGKVEVASFSVFPVKTAILPGEKFFCAKRQEKSEISEKKEKKYS